jgi:2-C-methyl-D-erythritol 4-phosphate cytidylyltransferase
MLLLAAGRGTRFGGSVPKAYLPLQGRPLLVHSAKRLLDACGPPHTAQLIVIVHAADRPTHLAACLRELENVAAGRAGLRVVDGGDSRQDSMRRGVAVVDADADLVLVHDAARALLPVAATRACIEAAAATGAALLAIPATDTLKRVRGGFVEATLDREGVWSAQTPQVLRRSLLQQALAAAAASGFEGTDDVSLVERLAHPVAVVEGSPTNVKITRPSDLPLAEFLLGAALA